jgi:hypothetical protein
MSLSVEIIKLNGSSLFFNRVIDLRGETGAGFQIIRLVVDDHPEHLPYVKQLSWSLGRRKHP